MTAAPIDTAPVQHFQRGGNYRAGIVGRLVIVHWRGAPTKTSVLEVEGLLVKLINTTPGPLGFLVGVPSGNPAPDAAARDAFANAMKAHADRVRASALVIEGTGLRSAANRAVLTAITLLGDISPTPAVCGTAREAAASISRLLVDPAAPPTTAEAIEAAYVHLATLP